MMNKFRNAMGGGRRGVQATTNSLPLSEAKIYLLNANSEEEEEGKNQEVAVDFTIEGLGGERVRTLNEATHVIYLDSSGKNKIEGEFSLNDITFETLRTAKSLNLPIVDISWLEKISGLRTGEHWSDVNLKRYVPSAVRKINDWLDDDDDPREVRRDNVSTMGASIGETYATMIEENPEDIEDFAMKRAIELSMLDWALVFRKPNAGGNRERYSKSGGDMGPNPYKILGISPKATPAEIKAAYRRKALETHPDKGGKPGEFELVARCYRKLLHSGQEDNKDVITRPIRSTANIDAELRDHQNLVKELFESHGANLQSNLENLEIAMNELGLYPKDAGASNINEKNERIMNSCFYLSLSASYLHGIGALSSESYEIRLDSKSFRNNNNNENDDDRILSPDEALIGETALDLKRTIEAAVVHAHPEWAEQGIVGEEVQAFSDFLVYVLDSQTILSDWAVAIFDSVSGFVDVYKGKNYSEDHLDWAKSNTISLKYLPEHYQPLFPYSQENRPTLSAMLKSLDNNGVLYTITDGSADVNSNGENNQNNNNSRASKANAKNVKTSRFSNEDSDDEVSV